MLRSSSYLRRHMFHFYSPSPRGMSHFYYGTAPTRVVILQLTSVVTEMIQQGTRKRLSGRGGNVCVPIKVPPVCWTEPQNTAVHSTDFCAEMTWRQKYLCKKSCTYVHSGCVMCLNNISCGFFLFVDLYCVPLGYKVTHLCLYSQGLGSFPSLNLAVL